MAEPSDPVGSAHKTLSAIAEVIKIAGDSPDMRAAGNELGKSLLTVTKLINNALLPIAAINFGFTKAREYFSTRFATEFTEKLKDVPEDQIIEPKASIAGPALQGLAFSHEEADLKNLYLSLLASAMDARVSSEVHPAFVEIIRQLCAEEAELLRDILKTPGNIAIVDLHARLSSGFVTVYRHLLPEKDPQTKQPRENRRIPSFVDNWIRLGLMNVDYNLQLMDVDSYDWVDDRPEVIRCRQQWNTADSSLEIRRGILRATSLGREFARMVGILDEFDWIALGFRDNR
jgi:hypothetical protein